MARSRISSAVVAGIRSSSVNSSCGLSTRGRLRGRFGDGIRSAGFCSSTPCSTSEPKSERSDASLRASVAGATLRSDSAAA